MLLRNQLEPPNFMLLEKSKGIIRVAHIPESLGGICPAMFGQCISTARMVVNEPAHVEYLLPMHHYPARRHGIV